MVKQAVTANPNASAATVTGAFVVVVVYLFGVAGVAIPPEVAVALTTLVTAAVLFFGRLEKLKR